MQFLNTVRSSLEGGGVWDLTVPFIKISTSQISFDGNGWKITIPNTQSGGQKFPLGTVFYTGERSYAAVGMFVFNSTASPESDSYVYQVKSLYTKIYPIHSWQLTSDLQFNLSLNVFNSTWSPAGGISCWVKLTGFLYGAFGIPPSQKFYSSFSFLAPLALNSDIGEWNSPTFDMGSGNSKEWYFSRIESNRWAIRGLSAPVQVNDVCILDMQYLTSS